MIGNRRGLGGRRALVRALSEMILNKTMETIQIKKSKASCKSAMEEFYKS